MFKKQLPNLFRVKASSLFILSGVLLSCTVQPEINLVQNTLSHQREVSRQNSSQRKQTHPVTFLVQAPFSQFKITQQATAQFVKLTVTNGQDVIFCSDPERDEQGFLASPGESFAIGAEVPDGNNWVATLGYYSNKTSPPFLELKTAFHVPAPGVIELNLRTHLVGDIVEQLQSLSAPVLDDPLELNAYQAFVDALTGYDFNDGNILFSRLTSLTPPNPTAISGGPIAVDIFNADLIPGEASGDSASPADYLPLPQHLGSYDSIVDVNNGDPVGDPSMVGAAGLQSLAIEPSNGRIFTHFNGVSSPFIEKFYGLIPNPSATHFFSEAFTPVTLANIQTSNLALGQANPTGSSPVKALYLLEKDNNINTNRIQFKALRQSDGALLWSHNFGDTNFGSFTVPFIPIVKNDDKETGGTSDDEDIVMVGVLTTTNSHASKGVYALRQTHPDDGSAEEVWFFDTGTADPRNGALSADQETLYITTGSGSGGKFITLDANDGTQINSVNLQGTSGTSPAIGTDGTIYVISSTSSQGFLNAFNPDGTIKWTETLPARSFVPPIVDRQNGQDVIYLITQGHTSPFNKHLNAYYADQTKKWATPYFLGSGSSFGPFTSPLVGEEVDGSRIIYQGMGDTLIPGTGKIYAVRDLGNSAALEFSVNPGGSVVAVELNLDQGVLYSATYNGGDGQIIGVQALKVSTPSFPEDAPWPKVYGDQKNSGNAHIP